MAFEKKVIPEWRVSGSGFETANIGFFGGTEMCGGSNERELVSFLHLEPARPLTAPFQL